MAPRSRRRGRSARPVRQWRTQVRSAGRSSPRLPEPVGVGLHPVEVRHDRTAGRAAPRSVRPQPNENRAADSRSRPIHRPAVMVTRERETPGCRASACATPRIPPPHRDVLDAHIDSGHAGRPRTGPRRTPRASPRSATAVRAYSRSVLEEGAGCGAGDRADHERPGEPLVGVRDRAGAHRLPEGPQVRHESAGSR